MRNALFSFLILWPVFSSFGQTADSGSIPVRVDAAFININGQIISSGEKPLSVTFYVVDYRLGIERSERTSVGEDGKFQIKFFIRNTPQVYWRRI